ncbi:fungal-specific transcription factor domain-containing protein [Pilaira anomala]|nr:fungal-specific transcription factor domain-containing protein [Pilaira anomala]
MDENGQVRYLGKSSGYYLLQNSRTYQNGAFHFANYGNRPRYEKRLNKSDPTQLPPKDLSQHLVGLYFDHFYPFLPLFYKRDLTASTTNTENKTISPLLLNSIYAVASRISPDIRVRSDPASPDTAGDVYFERAEKLLDESYDLPSISTVQALLLLASHQHGRMKSARAWLYSGMAFRMAQDLGLHRNCDHWNIPPDECERRKRVFWCCFVVDRLASAMYGRASTFEERDCDVPFPSMDDPEAIQGSNVRLLDTFINLIKICEVLGHVLKDIYYVRSLQNTASKQADTVLTTWNKRLHQWYDQLPDSLQIKKNCPTLPPTAVCQLHMIYHTTVILLHRPFIPGPNQSLVACVLPCASICSSAADSVLSIGNAMLSENKLRYVMNYAVYYIFTSAIIFIKSAFIKYPHDNTTMSHQHNKSLDARVKVTHCMRALDEIEGTWTTASKSCQILGELSGFRDFNSNWSQQQQNQHVPEYQNSQQVMEPTNLRFSVLGDANRKEQAFQSPRDNMEFNTTDLPFQMKKEHVQQPQENSSPSSTADPFAAPGIIPMTDTRQYHQLGTAFWGVPSSLDVNEWDNFMNSAAAAAGSDNHHSETYSQDRPFETSSVVGNYSTEKPQQHLIHTDQNVDILSGVSTPLERKAPPTLLSYLPHLQQQQQQNNNQSATASDGRPSSSSSNSGRDLANAHYW